MAWTRLYDEAEPQRVNRWLAQNGVCSRREAEGLIAQGLVSIDGRPVSDAGHKIEPGQTLTLADAAQSHLEGALTVILHKPVGVVSAQPEAGQIPAVRLLTRETLIGESPVIPGLTVRRRRSHPSISASSAGTKGRGPTRLISPRSTFQS